MVATDCIAYSPLYFNPQIVTASSEQNWNLNCLSASHLTIGSFNRNWLEWVFTYLEKELKENVSLSNRSILKDEGVLRRKLPFKDISAEILNKHRWGPSQKNNICSEMISTGRREILLRTRERERKIWIELKLAFFNILEGLMALSEQGVEARILPALFNIVKRNWKIFNFLD